MVTETAPEWGTSHHRGVAMDAFEWGKIPSSGQMPDGVSAKCKAWSNIYLKCNTIKVQKGIHCLKGSLTVQSIVHRSVLSDRVLHLGRWSVRLSRNCLGSEDELLEEVLLDELFQISSEDPAMDGLVFLAVMERAVLF